jgi:hypothetical protein
MLSTKRRTVRKQTKKEQEHIMAKATAPATEPKASVSRSQTWKHEDFIAWATGEGLMTADASPLEAISTFAANRGKWRKTPRYRTMVTGRKETAAAERTARTEARKAERAVAAEAKKAEREAAKAAKAAEAAAAPAPTKAAAKKAAAAPAKATKATKASAAAASDNPFG